MPLHWNDLKFVLSTIFVTIYLSIVIISKKESKIWFSYIDLFFLWLIVLGFLSGHWSIDSSLRLPFAFNWILLFIWILIFRFLTVFPKHKENFGKAIRYLFLLSSILIGTILIFETGDTDWNYWFGNNRNHVAGLHCILLPHYLLSVASFKKANAWIIFGFTISAAIAIAAQSVGVILALMIILLLYLTSIKKTKHTSKYLFLLFGLIIIFCTVFLDTKLNISFQDTQTILYETRLSTITESVRPILESPLIGHGLGNWYNTVHWIGSSSHNLYLLILIELGLLGLFLFIAFLTSILWHSLNYRKSTFTLASFNSIIIYMILASVYNISNTDQHIFGIIQFYAFCNIGFCSLPRKIHIRHNLIIIGTLLFSLCTLIWFSSARYYNQVYRKAKTHMQSKPEIAKEYLQKYYHPKFRTTVFTDRKIPVMLASLYQKAGNNSEARHYYTICERICPNNLNYLVSYSSFLYYEENDTIEAYRLMQKAENIQKNSNELNLLMARYYIDKNESYEAQNKLNLVKSELPYYQRRIRKMKREINLIAK